MAFPKLVPDGKGDPTNPALTREVTLQDSIKHLIRFSEYLNEKWVYRVASHPRFIYWALTMIQRRQALQQSSIFLKQNQDEAHMTLNQLHEMASNNSSDVFLSKISRYVANIADTNAYWHRAREDLKAIVINAGITTFCFSFSSGDMHWSELHDLFGKKCQNIIAEERRQNLINNPHLVDWYFTQRLDSFIKTLAL